MGVAGGGGNRYWDEWGGRQLPNFCVRRSLDGIFNRESLHMCVRVVTRKRTVNYELRCGEEETGVGWEKGGNRRDAEIWLAGCQ